MLGGGVGLQECEEGLLDGEVRRVPDDVDVGLAGELARLGVGGEKASVVRR